MRYYFCLRKKVILTCSAQLHLRFLLCNKGSCVLEIRRAETSLRQSRKRAQVQRKETFTKHLFKLRSLTFQCWCLQERKLIMTFCFQLLFCALFQSRRIYISLFWTKSLIGVKYLCCCAGAGARSHGVWSSWESTPGEETVSWERKQTSEWMKYRKHYRSRLRAAQ